MKKVIYVMLMFLSIFIFSCGGGSDGGSDDVITPPVLTVDPPSMATLNSPANNKVCEEGTSVSETESNVNFQWTAGSNTDSYDLRITNLNSDQVINQSKITSTNKAVSLDKGTPYLWKITSKRNGTSETAESSTWKFYLSGDGLINYPPYPSELVLPKSGKTFSSSNESVELYWEGSHPQGLTLIYDIFVDTIDGQQTPESSNKNISNTNKSISVNAGNTYYWRIKATDTNGNSSYSLIYSFIVE
ncbi:hypothetical protein N9P53_04145 [Flavobacteriaceae bacterium]|nr:hypothetical protein [Flavobacteriaceae bacterium]